MKKKEIGIVILATNAYFVLGLRFVRRFIHFYKGEADIKFYFFSDKFPDKYLPVHIETLVEFHQTQHSRWVDGTNSKFLNILKLEHCTSDYLFYFDADTNIQKDFSEEWMMPDAAKEHWEKTEIELELVGGEHYSNRTTLKDGIGFDRNPIGNSYVPMDSPLPYTYHYGAFFGGSKLDVIAMMSLLRSCQEVDQRINYEPPVNDESYINKYFHYNQPYTVPIEAFSFVVSDKGGLGDTRKMLNTQLIEDAIRLNRDELWDIQNGKIKFDRKT
jgi:hypothetical protein